MEKTQALLIGINYIGQAAELNGCINDVNDIRKILVEKFKVSSSNITMMTDNSPRNLKPTRQNIIGTLIQLVIKAYRGEIDKLILHYSGHGFYMMDLNADEVDNWDEVLCPVDYETNGFIKDDLLNSIMGVLPKTCKVFALIDSCNSGTAMDLKYKHKYGDERVTIESDKNLKAEIIMISGCKDDQYSSDAYISGRFNGAMTKAFLESLKQSNYDVSYFDLLANMRQYLVQHDFTQLPQLSSSVKLTNESIFSAAKTNPPFLSV
jgi:metacaspase-1